MSLNRPTRLVLALLMLAAAAGLLYASGAARERGSGTTVSGDLTITWSKAKDGLNISATGFRRKSSASVSVASKAKKQVTADDTGTVRVFVAVDAATEGRTGTTVVVVGRAPSNATKSLVGGVPPLDMDRSPQDALPWVIAGLLVLLAAALAGVRVPTRVGGRHTGRRKAAEARAIRRGKTPPPTRVRVADLLSRPPPEPPETPPATPEPVAVPVHLPPVAPLPSDSPVPGVVLRPAAEPRRSTP